MGWRLFLISGTANSLLKKIKVDNALRLLPGSKGFLKYFVHGDQADDGAQDLVNIRVFHDMFYVYSISRNCKPLDMWLNLTCVRALITLLKQELY